ncbi:hypothetical protein [Streptomyces sp. LaPpAH-108]|uniref:hypothetical protein n=1 Tax=Streptomyces sp. LaPpAH-108 TaxID=1155714 RepID=UPI00037516E0|nr:hypothetical protein [Streptomyces sp. LaPpAH-108]
MGYELRAVIADWARLESTARELPAARLAPLAQGLALLPLTDALFAADTDGSEVTALGFRGLPDGFEAMLARWSAAGPVACVEAEVFGGVGEQRAAVWEGGAVVLGPLHVDEDEPFPAEGSPVSRALRRLGVRADAGRDEFDAVGLGRRRSSEEWVDYD